MTASTSETQGLTYIEALASGLPVIARDDACLDGVLTSGENGYAFRDEGGLLYYLDKMLDSAELARMSKNAEAGASKFSVMGYAEVMADIYKLAAKRFGYRHVS